jgi:hypothetical protein
LYHPAVASGHSQYLMKAGSKRRRTREQMLEQRDDEANRERVLAEQLNELENLQLAKMRLEQENERGAHATRLI